MLRNLAGVCLVCAEIVTKAAQHVRLFQVELRTHALHAIHYQL